MILDNSTLYNSILFACDGFKKYFNINGKQFMDPLMTSLTEKFNLDIVKLDDWLHLQGYTEEQHGSMKDYIGLRYGNLAVNFINELLSSAKIRRIIKRRNKVKRIIKRRNIK